MKLHSLVTKSIVVACCLLLVSCAGTYRAKPTGMTTYPSDPNDAMATGLGEQGAFTGSQRQNQTALMAPHDQTYHFAFDDSVINSEDKPSMQAQARYLREHPDARVLLTGHTDERGSREYNIALGERRAKSVAQYLQLLGVHRRQLRVVSYGEEKPVVYTHDEAAWQQNRRVELIYEAIR